MLLAAEDNSGVVSHVDPKTVEVALVAENHCSLHSRRWDLTKDLCTLRSAKISVIIHVAYVFTLSVVQLYT